MIDCKKTIKSIYKKHGLNKSMLNVSNCVDRPNYFLHRTFLLEQDLLVIFNTKRCRYQCLFCDLPQESSNDLIIGENIINQFIYVVKELKHSLGVLDRITLSNNGSVLDIDTFQRDALLNIIMSTHELPRMSKIVLESRIEFVDQSYIEEIKKANHRVTIDILSGFETLDEYIRDFVLGKKESIDDFLNGLDIIEKCKAKLTSYILYKPYQVMTDEEAFREAENSINFLVKNCKKRNIPLTIRINPMYAAIGTPWSKIAAVTPKYSPPKLLDVVHLAQKKREEGLKVYIGLSTENKSEMWGNFKYRNDYSKNILKQAIFFNKEFTDVCNFRKSL